MLPHALPYILLKFKYIEMYVLILKKTMVTQGNVLQLAQNQANLKENIQ